MPSRHGRTWVAGAVLAVGATTACSAGSAGSPAVAPPVYEEPTAYRFSLDSGCGERSLIGQFDVSVRDGAVEDVRGRDGSARALIKSGSSDLVPTLAELVAELADAAAANADRTDATFDPVDGHPIEIKIDFDKDVIDDESCYTITDYLVDGSTTEQPASPETSLGASDREELTSSPSGS